MWELVDREGGPYVVTSGGHLNLTSLLSLTDDFRTTDPKDRIYALVGIFRHRNGQAELPTLLVPDYNRPQAHIYRDALKYLLQEIGTLSPLHRLSHRTSSELDAEGSPSWVPRYDREWDEEQDPVELAKVWDASRSVSLHVSDHLDEDVLQLHGILSATITSAAEIFEGSRGYAGAIELLDQVKNMTSELFEGKDDPTCVETIGTTLIAGTNERMIQAEEEDIQAFSMFLKYIKEEKCVPRGPGQDNVQLDETTRAATLYWLNLLMACNRRRVFTTEDGRLGVGPKALRKGDVVAVLFGGATPYILRPVGDEYQFLGQAYVYGITNGELVREHQSAGRQDMIFKIR